MSTISAIAAGSPPPFNMDAPVVPDPAADAKAQSAYPQMAWALADPELGNILRYAAKYGESANWLQGQIQQTTWYRTHGQASRAWADLAANDPAEAARRINAQALAIKNTGVSLGAQLTDAQVKQIATDSLVNGWTQPELTQHINNYVTYSAGGLETDLSTGRRAYYGPNGEPGGPGPESGTAHWVQPDGTTVYYTPGNMAYADPNRAANTPGAQPFTIGQPGQIGTQMADLKKIAADYMVPMSDASLFQWAREIADGRADANTFTTDMKNYAKSLHPEAAAAIDRGQTTSLFYEPIKQQIAQTLELDPNSINMADPKWLGLAVQTDPTGTRTVTPLNVLDQQLKSDPIYGYQHTSGAVSQAYDKVTQLATTLGAIK